MGEDIETLVDYGHIREVWSKIQRWYQEAKGHPTPPTREGLEHTSILREDLYRRCPSEDEAIPILVQPVIIAEGPPEGEYIEVTVRILKFLWEVGPSGMKSEHLKAWLRGATREKDPDTTFGQTDECDEFSVPGQTHPRGTGMYNDGAHS